jgi:hypothetical protein
MKNCPVFIYFLTKSKLFEILIFYPRDVGMITKIFRATVLLSHVADPGCLSRIPGPVIYPSGIPDLGFNNSNKRGGGKNLLSYLFL